jgi:hypothetical protein
MAKKSNTVVCEISNEKLLEFIKKCQDLIKIDDKIFIKLDKTNLLLYSLVGKNDDIHAFKSHIIKLKDMFENISGDFENLLMIVGSISEKNKEARKLIQNLTNFSDYQENSIWTFHFNESNIIEKLSIKNSKLKIDINAGIASVFKQQIIDVDQIKEATNPEYANFSFVLSKEDYERIKKMSSIDLENDMLYLNIADKKLSIGESTWSLELSKLDYDDNTFSFPKKYFKTIQFKHEESTIYVFDNFIFITGEDTNLMISVEFSI